MKSAESYNRTVTFHFSPSVCLFLNLQPDDLKQVVTAG